VGESFKLTGIIEKSVGKGQQFELKLKGESYEKAVVYGRCDNDKYPLAGKNISL
jgi:hypothetical protein